MSNLGYYSRCGSTRRGFRVHPSKRLSVKTLRARFVCLVRLLNGSYRAALRALRRGFCRENRPASVLTTSKRDRRFSSSTRKPLVIKEMNRMMTRSNSFYSEAIKECLEFIKRNSVSADQQSRSSSGGPEEEEDRDREISSNTILLSKIV